MKTTMRVLLIAVAGFLPCAMKAQGTSDIFDPKVPFTWVGLDFSRANIIGERERITSDAALKDMIVAWNDLMAKEPDKYNPKKAFHKEQMTTDFTPTTQHNENLDLGSMLVENPIPGSELNSDIIQDIVNDYDFGSLSGLGLMLNVESFNKPANKASIWATFVNLDTKQVLFTELMVAPPAGRGVRNFWGSTVFVMFEKVQKKDFAVWSLRKNEIVIAQPTAAARPTTTKPAPVKQEVKTIEPAPQAKRDVTKTTGTTPDAAATADPKSIKPGGQYYALLIGISKYNDPRLNLDQPVNDARKMKETLGAFYDFPAGNIVLLENPTRGEIFSALYKLRDRVTANDNLLLFYAGHGFWDEKIKQGYWWPRDATTSDPSNWLSNSDLREQLRGINSAHTLLVSDACFSGGIFRTRDASAIKGASIDYQMLYKMPSRRAITSGTLTAVPDKSVFVDYLIKRLSQNQEKFLPAQQLFSTMRLAIINNSATVPQEGVIAETGDEGGDFIFMRKDVAKAK